MYCRNCANQMDDKAAICVKCGVSKGEGTAFCQNCGAPTGEQAICCTNCGAELKKPVAKGEPKSKLAAGLFGIFLGSIGVHNFYLGYTGKAISQLLISVLSCGFLAVVSGIWGLIEGILVLTGSIKTDAKGIPLKD